MQESWVNINRKGGQHPQESTLTMIMFQTPNINRPGKHFISIKAGKVERCWIAHLLK